MFISGRISRCHERFTNRLLKRHPRQNSKQRLTVNAGWDLCGGHILLQQLEESGFLKVRILCESGVRVNRSAIVVRELRKVSGSWG